ncbi:hypothetical protein KJ853_04445 [Patescibacteria group bacterium]|nr:hypothetical protein [Patescibacteria group bacterium]
MAKRVTALEDFAIICRLADVYSEDEVESAFFKLVSLFQWSRLICFYALGLLFQHKRKVAEEIAGDILCVEEPKFVL